MTPDMHKIPPMPVVEHNLFFAAFPDAAVLGEIRMLADSLKANDPSIRMIAAERWHVTLRFLGGYAIISPEPANTACRAVQGIDADAFDLVFDGLRSFGHPVQLALALCCSRIPPRAAALWTELGVCLDAAGLTNRAPLPFDPHITLARAKSAQASPSRIDPIRMRIDAFSLIDSLIGGASYRHIAHWPLDAGRDSTSQAR